MHQPLYPPGRIIHIVRNHPKKEEKLVKKHDPVYQALWADNTDFDEVLISPVMVQDHMPDKVLDALKELLVNTGPAKPQRQLSETERRQLLSPNLEAGDLGTLTPPHRLVLETSFTDLQPEIEETAPDKNELYQSNISWEYPTASNVSLPDDAQAYDGERKDWVHLAPLASPETLSDVSSISSKGSSHQKLNNGNRLSWSGVPTMEPIAQSPAVQRLNSYSVRAYTSKSPDFSIQMDSCSRIREEENCSTYKVVTEATVEVNAAQEEQRSSHLMDPSHLCLDIDVLEKNVRLTNSDCLQFGADSTYASTSTEQTIDKLFTPHEPKRVTFDLYDKQRIAREVSEDSMYNSGESFVPTYPEYSNQQEYGSHGYMYTPCGYTNLSPASSPVIEHSVSDVQLFKLVEEPFLHRTHEKVNIGDEDPIITSSPIKSHQRNLTFDTETISAHSNRNESRSESSL